MENRNGNGKGSGSLKGRTALITGAARGIGRAIAVELAHRGAAIAVNYQSGKAAAEGLARETCEAGRECILVPGNVADKDTARRVVTEAADRWGHLDILVNNAGITRDTSLRKVADDEWSDVINVNLNGTYYCTSAALPYMMQQKFGRIINITSLIGQTGTLDRADYAGNKGGIPAFTRRVALEMARYNITANCIAPGYTWTEMLEGVPEEVIDALKARIPLGRLGTPAEIGKAAAFLAAEADYMTGQQLSINGGVFMA